MKKWSSVILFIVIFIRSTLEAGIVEQKCEYVFFKKDRNGEWLLTEPYAKNCSASFGKQPDEYITKRLQGIKGQFQQQISEENLKNCEIASKVRLGKLRDVFPYEGHHYIRTFSLKLVCDNTPVAFQYFKISSEVEDIANIDEEIHNALAQLNGPCQECMSFRE